MTNNFFLEIITEDLPYKNSFKFVINFVKIFITQINKKKYLYNNINWNFTHRRIVLKIYNLYSITSHLYKKNIFFNEFKIIFNNIFIQTLKTCNINQKSIVINANQKNNFIRPVKNLLVLLNNKLIKLNVFNIISSKNTLSHIFIKNNVNIKINSCDNYEKYLYSQGNVIINYQYRKFFLLLQIKNLEFIYNIHIDYVSIIDELIFYKEWPILIKSNFNKKFLKLPNEIIIYIIKKKQKSFVVYNKNNHKLLNMFFSVINVNLNNSNEQKIILNFSLIINNLLTEIDFFLFNDRKIKLIDNLKKLKYIYYDKRIGSIYDKTKRIKYLLIKLSDIFKINKQLLIKLSIISKCDLSTLLVQEYHDLIGLTGKCYSKLDLIKSELSLALQEQYQKITNNKLSSLLILSDKIDDLVGLISLHFINKKISLKQDPYEIRRKTIQLIESILNNNINIDLLYIINYCKNIYKKNKFYTVKSSIIIDFIYLKYINCIKKYKLNYLIIKSTIKFLNITNNILLVHKKIYFLHNKINSFFFNKIIEIYKRTNNLFENINKSIFIKYIKNKLSNDNLEIAMWQVIIICNYFCNNNIILNYNYGNHIFFYLYKLSTYIEHFLNNRQIFIKNNIISNNRIFLIKNVNFLLLKLTDLNIIINNK